MYNIKRCTRTNFITTHIQISYLRPFLLYLRIYIWVYFYGIINRLICGCIKWEIRGTHHIGKPHFLTHYRYNVNNAFRLLFRLERNINGFRFGRVKFFQLFFFHHGKSLKCIYVCYCSIYAKLLFVTICVRKIYSICFCTWVYLVAFKWDHCILRFMNSLKSLFSFNTLIAKF